MENELRTVFNEFINPISKITDLEFAVFDTNFSIISSTQTYSELKGNSVFQDSLEDVFTNERTIVNRPGFMESCIGCRFLNNCPSKIEIVTRIENRGKVFGALTLTCFDEATHNKIVRNQGYYEDFAENITKVFSNYLTQEYLYNVTGRQDSVLSYLIDYIDEPSLIIDNHGEILAINSEFKKKYEDLIGPCQYSIDQLFPSNVIKWILSTNGYQSDVKMFNGTQSEVHVTNITSDVYIVLFKNIHKIENDTEHSKALNDIISKDHQINNLKKLIQKMENSNSTVLITGETGTGKELFAKAFHYSSCRKDGPFIAINCAAFPKELFESELFGYEAGTFTGARKNGKKGLIELADKGTLFLDEIGELPLDLQTKLLRFIQEGTIRRLGSLNTTRVDTRIISATNKNLEQCVEDGSFRSDLYFRLCVVPVEIPPLRYRKDDIKELSYVFLNNYSKNLKKKISTIQDETFEILCRYNWPGNIRELKNVIEYACNLTDDNQLKPENLPIKILKNIKTQKKYSLENAEINLILDLLDEHGHDADGKKKVSELLGISLRTLYRKLEKA